ncbi:MAG: 2-oxo acid dehydrogenase subunit E2 [Actinomycetota bacterium]|nr:2-oxo acid dehydrogenase subunit E2 [Actinomycetota bacterium]MDH5223881.1 2-oxo acid dehydrogenase subunit E2 [Actinomycetota bacterium]MDH5312985.1 2-oxo acid dehydrogenase subunit E2 [Actinomycetota bacterium]
MSAERLFSMPDLGEGLEEGEIVEWLVAEGDTVALNQPLVEVETAKATVEVPSPYAGVVISLHGPVGSTIAVGGALATFAVADEVAEDGDSSGQPQPGADADSAATPDQHPSRGGRTTPPVRKLAKELGVDLASVVGSGADGRITAEDVEAARGSGAPATSADAASRKVIATNLERQAAIPQVTTFRTVDCSALQVFRKELGVSPLPVVVAALCRTIAMHPSLNALWGDGQVTERDRVHVGLATDTERGLVVPVVRDAHSLGIADIAAEVARLAEAARAGSLSPADLTGATVAVSNTGSYGSEAGTPILSPGTSVTLAVGVIEARALIADGAVVARPACTLSCTFDHRVLDGAVVGRALGDLVEVLTSADRLGDLRR